MRGSWGARHPVWIALALVVLVVSAASAQQTDLPPAAIQRLERLRMERLRETLELDDATARDLGAMMQEFRRQRRDAAVAQREATQRLQRTLRQQPVDDAEVARALEELERRRLAAERLGQRQRAELGRILSPSQQARFLLFNRQFDQRLRREITERRLRRSPEQGASDRRASPRR